ncbi:UNVERIFIED_CONTAM: hypothetical protein NCL1_62014 [Trichonephila clavipes]
MLPIQSTTEINPIYIPVPSTSNAMTQIESYPINKQYGTNAISAKFRSVNKPYNGTNTISAWLIWIIKYFVQWLIS